MARPQQKSSICILTLDDGPCEAKFELRKCYARRTMHARGNGRRLCAAHFTAEVRQESKAGPRIQFNIDTAFLSKYVAVFVQPVRGFPILVSLFARFLSTRYVKLFSSSFVLCYDTGQRKRV